MTLSFRDRIFQSPKAAPTSIEEDIARAEQIHAITSTIREGLIGKLADTVDQMEISPHADLDSIEGKMMIVGELRGLANDYDKSIKELVGIKLKQDSNSTLKDHSRNVAELLRDLSLKKECMPINELSTIGEGIESKFIEDGGEIDEGLLRTDSTDYS